MNNEEAVRVYADEIMKKSDVVERRILEQRRLSYEERRVNA